TPTNIPIPIIAGSRALIQQRIFRDSHGAGDGIQAKNHEIIRCYTYGLSLATWLSYRVLMFLSKMLIRISQQLTKSIC
ncbi:MAG: hypothetical protein J6J59_04050, partial [Peptococcaceae bacterium]|nr:hypothetical protein [Peptococcaceae bacterium]